MSWLFLQFADADINREPETGDGSVRRTVFPVQRRTVPLLLFAAVLGTVLYNLGDHSLNHGGDRIQPIMNRALVTTFAASPDGHRVATGDMDGTVVVWDAKSREILFSDDVGIAPVRSLAFSPDRRTLAMVGLDRFMRLWDVQTGARLTSLEIASQHGASEIGFSPDGRFIAVMGFAEKDLEIWDWQARPAKRVAGIHNEDVRAFAFDPTGATIATAGRAGQVRLRELPSGRTSSVFVASKRAVVSLAFSPSGRTLAIGSLEDRVIRLWDTTTLKPTVELPGHDGPYTFAVFSRDGSRLASVAFDGNVRIWDPNTGQCLGAGKGQAKWLRGLAFAADNRTLVTPDLDTGIRFLDVDDLINSMRGQSRVDGSAR